MKVDTSWVNDELLDALKMTESSGKNFQEDGTLTVNPTSGALGAYQILPSNFGYLELDPKNNPGVFSETLGAAGYGTKYIDKELLKDEAYAREWARSYLEGMQRQYPHLSQTDILRAYNAGPGTVKNFYDIEDKNKQRLPAKEFFTAEALAYPDKVFSYLPKAGGEPSPVIVEEPLIQTAEASPEIKVQEGGPLSNNPLITNETTNQYGQIQGNTDTVSTLNYMGDAAINLRSPSSIPEGRGANYRETFNMILTSLKNDPQKRFTNADPATQRKMMMDVLSGMGLPEYMTVKGVKVGFNKGGEVPPIQYYAKGTDTVPAMLTPGEAVIPMEAAQHPVFKPLIKNMIDTGRAMQDNNVIPIQGFNDGTSNVQRLIEKALQENSSADPFAPIPMAGVKNIPKSGTIANYMDNIIPPPLVGGGRGTNPAWTNLGYDAIMKEDPAFQPTFWQNPFPPNTGVAVSPEQGLAMEPFDRSQGIQNYINALPGGMIPEEDTRGWSFLPTVEEVLSRPNELDIRQDQDVGASPYTDEERAIVASMNAVPQSQWPITNPQGYQDPSQVPVESTPSVNSDWDKIKNFTGNVFDFYKDKYEAGKSAISKQEALNDMRSRRGSSVGPVPENVWTDEVTGNTWVKTDKGWVDPNDPNKVLTPLSGFGSWNRLNSFLNSDKNKENYKEAYDIIKAKHEMGEVITAQDVEELADLQAEIDLNESADEVGEKRIEAFSDAAAGNIKRNLDRVNKNRKELIAEENAKRKRLGLPPMSTAEETSFIKQAKEVSWNPLNYKGGLPQWIQNLNPYLDSLEYGGNVNFSNEINRRINEKVPELDLPTNVDESSITYSNDGGKAIDTESGIEVEISKDGEVNLNTGPVWEEEGRYGRTDISGDDGNKVETGEEGDGNENEEKDGDQNKKKQQGNATGIFNFIQDTFGFGKQEVMRALLYYAAGRISGGSHGGSLQWAGQQVVQEMNTRGKLQAQASSDAGTAFRSARTSYEKRKKEFSAEYQALIDEAMANERTDLMQMLMAKAYQNDGQGLSPLAQVAYLDEAPVKARQVDSKNIVEVYRSKAGDSTYYYQKANGEIEQIDFSGGNWKITSGDLLDNLKNVNKDYWKGLNKKDQELLDKTFKGSISESTWNQALLDFGAKYGKSPDAMRSLGNQVFQAAEQGVIPEDISLTGFLETTVLKPEFATTPGRLAAFNDGLVAEEVAVLSREIKNSNASINGIISETDKDLARLDIIAPTTLKETRGNYFPQIESMIKSNFEYQALTKDKALSKKYSKVLSKVNYFMEKENPYIALLYLNTLRVDNPEAQSDFIKNPTYIELTKGK